MNPLKASQRTMNPLSASQSTVCGLAWKRYSRQTPLRDAAPALNGRASPAEGQPCRTAGARFTAARVLGRGRRRAWSAAGGQIGNTGTFRGKPRRNGRACGRQYLRSGTWAPRSKGPRGPAVGYESAHFGPGLAMIPTAPIDTRESSVKNLEAIDRSP